MMVEYELVSMAVLAAGFGAMVKTGIASSGIIGVGSSFFVGWIKKKMPKKAKWTLPLIGIGLGAGAWYGLNAAGMPGAEEIANGFVQAFELPVWGGDVIAGATSGGLGSLGYSSIHSFRKNREEKC